MQRGKRQRGKETEDGEDSVTARTPALCQRQPRRLSCMLRTAVGWVAPGPGTISEQQRAACSFRRRGTGCRGQGRSPGALRVLRVGAQRPWARWSADGGGRPAPAHRGRAPNTAAAAARGEPGSAAGHGCAREHCGDGRARGAAEPEAVAARSRPAQGQAGKEAGAQGRKAGRRRAASPL